MFVKIPEKITFSEFLQLPETKPIQEYINGYIYAKPMPKGKHSTIQTFLTSAINQQGLPQKKCCAFTELRYNLKQRSIVPDISVMEWNNIPKDDQGEIKNSIDIPPNWLIEILSPQQISIRVIDNILFSLNQGTELGWLIDPQEKIVMIFLPNQQPEIKENNQLLTILPILSPWQLSPQDIFN